MSAFNILQEFNSNLLAIEDELKTTGTTDDKNLNKLGKKIFGLKFVGVFSSNTILLLKTGQMCIANTKSTHSHGEHWIALVKDRDNKIYFYDAFCRDYKKLSPYWTHKRWINANKYVRNEAYVARNCGQLCMTWLLSFYNHGKKIFNIV